MEFTLRSSRSLIEILLKKKRYVFLDLCGSFLVVYNVSSMYAVWPVMYIGFGILAYGIVFFLFMKYSFIKDLNGLEIVIMYIPCYP
jgi:hypothetical protein